MFSICAHALGGTLQPGLQGYCLTRCPIAIMGFPNKAVERSALCLLSSRVRRHLVETRVPKARNATM